MGLVSTVLYTDGFAYDSTIPFPIPVGGLTCRNPIHYHRHRIYCKEILHNTLSARKEIYKRKSSIPSLSPVPSHSPIVVATWYGWS